MRELKPYMALQHPNIIKIHEVFKTKKKRLNIVMEYADGGNLRTKINEKRAEGGYWTEEKVMGWFF